MVQGLGFRRRNIGSSVPDAQYVNPNPHAAIDQTGIIQDLRSSSSAILAGKLLIIYFWDNEIGRAGL